VHEAFLAEYSFALALAYVPKLGFALGKPLPYQGLAPIFRKMRQARQYRSWATRVGLSGKRLTNLIIGDKQLQQIQNIG
jgi:hypothetical protein